MTDLIEKGSLSVVYTPTDLLTVNFHTKELQGNLFHRHCRTIMGQDAAKPKKFQDQNDAKDRKLASYKEAEIYLCLCTCVLPSEEGTCLNYKVM